MNRTRVISAPDAIVNISPDLIDCAGSNGSKEVQGRYFLYNLNEILAVRYHQSASENT